MNFFDSEGFGGGGGDADGEGEGDGDGFEVPRREREREREKLPFIGSCRREIYKEYLHKIPPLYFSLMETLPPSRLNTYTSAKGASQTDQSGMEKGTIR